LIELWPGLVVAITTSSSTTPDPNTISQFVTSAMLRKVVPASMVSR